MSRKAPRPVAWLGAVQAATAAFCGRARVVEDSAAPAGATSFRGAGYHVTSIIEPERPILGPLPEGPWEVCGETARPPDARLDLSTLFPPDSLRSVPYWDCARAGAEQPVLVVMASPPLLRLLSGPEDDLPDAVALIHHWLELPAAERGQAVRAALSTPGQSPVAYVAGFELLASGEPDAEALFSEFEGLPGRPGAAVQGILEELQRADAGMPPADLRALAAQLLAAWSHEADPAAISGYLLWFDAHRQQTWLQDAELREGVVSQARRAGTLSFSGPYAQDWERQVRYYVSVLLRAGGYS